MKKERLHLLFIKYVNQELTPEEIRELMAYIDNGATDTELEELLREEWSYNHDQTIFDKAQSDSILKKIMSDESLRNKVSLKYNRIKTSSTPSAEKRPFIPNLMLRNYMKVALRTLFKNKSFSFVNIAGLAVGMAACLLILQYLNFEFSYDNFHTKEDRLYRVNEDRYTNHQLSTQWAAGSSAAGPAFKAAVPEIEGSVRLWNRGQIIAGYKDEKLVVNNDYFVENGFFQLFSFPLLEGDPATALKEPNSAVLNASAAKKLFHNINPLGQTITVGRQSLKITGIMQDMPDNTHLKLEFIQSYATLPILYPEETFFLGKQWFADGFLTYVLLRPGADPKAVEKKFVPIANAGMSTVPNEAAVFSLQKVKDIHLYSNRMGEVEPNGSGKSVYLLLGIAIFVIVIAWINYINLATARGMSRAKEVGVRKTLGSGKLQLLAQFMVEAMVLNGLSIVLAIGIIMLSVPVFASLTGLKMGLTLLIKPMFWTAVFVLFLIGSFFSGFYPAIVLSGYKPVTVLKGKVTTSSEGAILRKGMVVFQFAASIFLLIGSMTVWNQVRFMQSQKLGFNIDQTLVIRSPLVQIDSMSRAMTSFKQESLGLLSVKSITISTDVPGTPIGWNMGRLRLAGASEDKGVQARIIGTDYDFLKAYDIKLLAGRFFSQNYATDKGALILSRSSLALFGLTKPEEAIGKKLIFQREPRTIVGVVNDYHQQSLRDKYDAIIFTCIPDVQGKVSVKVGASNITQTVAALKTNWAKFFPGDPFDYVFLDQQFNAQYRADQRFSKVFGIFTLIAIFVACLGLFGLVSYTIVQRTKEIGIRKVLGASVRGILQLLYKDFALLILIAFVIAAPTAYYAINQWLHGYAFRIDVNPLLFIVPFLGVSVIAFATVSWLSVKAALMNPVVSLKTE